MSEKGVVLYLWRVAHWHHTASAPSIYCATSLRMKQRKRKTAMRKYACRSHKMTASLMNVKWPIAAMAHKEMAVEVSIK